MTQKYLTKTVIRLRYGAAAQHCYSRISYRDNLNSLSILNKVQNSKALLILKKISVSRYKNKPNYMPQKQIYISREIVIIITFLGVVVRYQRYSIYYEKLYLRENKRNIVLENISTNKYYSQYQNI